MARVKAIPVMEKAFPNKMASLLGISRILIEGEEDFNDTRIPSFGIAQWGIRPDGVYIAQQKTAKTLPSAEYMTGQDAEGNILFKKITPSGDELLMFHSGIADNIFKEILNFWSKKEVFKKAGFLHKRGILLYGPAGTGKTSIVSQISKQIVKSNGIVLHCSRPHLLRTALEQARKIEPSRPIVCVFEDIDAIIRENGEDEILSLLDGNNQVDNILNMATTNYPERLDRRIISRPRRFDRIYKIPAPEESVKREYLKAKLPKSEKLSLWMEKTVGLSFAALTEAVISVTCLGNTLSDTIQALRELEDGSPSSDDFGKNVPVGFGTVNREEISGKPKNY